VKGAPGLNIGSVHGDARTARGVLRHRRPDKTVGKELGIDAFPPSIDLGIEARLQQPGELHEQVVHPIVGLGAVPPGDAESETLTLAHRVQRPGNLHEVGLMVWAKRVQLRRDEETFKRERSGSSGGGIELPR